MKMLTHMHKVKHMVVSTFFVAPVESLEKLWESFFTGKTLTRHWLPEYRTLGQSTTRASAAVRECSVCRSVRCSIIRCAGTHTIVGWCQQACERVFWTKHVKHHRAFDDEPSNTSDAPAHLQCSVSTIQCSSGTSGVLHLTRSTWCTCELKCLSDLWRSMSHIRPVRGIGCSLDWAKPQEPNDSIWRGSL